MNRDHASIAGNCARRTSGGGLSGARRIVLDAALHGGWDLHIGCTGFSKPGFKVSGFQGLEISKIPIAGLLIRHVQDKI